MHPHPHATPKYVVVRVRSVLASASLLLWLCAAILSVLVAYPATAQRGSAPNIVYILSDDQGWGDTRANNPACGFPTPGIDRLAREGMRFTDAHSASAVCTPTRYALLTGRYAWRTHLQKGVLGNSADGNDPLIAEHTLTVGELLQTHGYKTACIGKWHLGFRYLLPEGQAVRRIDGLGGTFSVPVGTRVVSGPTRRGFDLYEGFHHAREMATWIEGDLVTENIHVRQMLPRITERAVDYIKQRAQADDGPFFLYLPLSSPHTPIVPTEPWQGKSGLNAYADFVMQTDDTVVRVLDALDAAGLTDNTLVIFTADNGCSPQARLAALRGQGHDPMAGLRGHKADIWEGGHRVPFVARWPGRVPPGAVSDEPICLNSLIATCADMLGVALADDQGVDSFSILPLLLGEQPDDPTHPVIVHHSIHGKFAVRQGHWKYIACTGSGGWSRGGDGKPAQLYNLKDDRAEANNLIDERPDIAREMRELLLRVVREGRSTPGPPQDNDVPVNP